MKKLIVLLLIVPMFTLFAQSKEANISKLLKLTKFEEQMKQLSDGLKAGLMEMGLSAHPKGEKLTEVFEKYLGVKSIVSEMKKGYVSGYDEAKCNKVIEFYESDFGQKIINVELDSNTPENQAKTQELMKNFMTNPPSDTRKQYLQEYIKNTDLIKVQTEISTIVVELMMNNMNKILPQEQRKSEGEISMGLQMMKTQMAAQLEQTVEFTILAKYAELSDDELKKMADFFATPAGKWYMKSGFVGVENGLKSLAENFTKGLTDALK